MNVGPTLLALCECEKASPLSVVFTIGEKQVADVGTSDGWCITMSKNIRWRIALYSKYRVE